MRLNKLYSYLGGLSFFLSCIFGTFTIFSLILCQDNRIKDLNSLYITKAKSESNINDIFSEDIARISSINEAKIYIDKTLVSNNQKEIAEKTLNFIRNSYVHRLSYLYPCENWVIYLISEIPLQIIKEKRFNAIYDPERQLSAPFAFCSQNSIILQALLKEYGISYSSVAVGIPELGHYAVAAKLDGVWYFLDGNIEYEIQKTGWVKLDDFLNPENKDMIYTMYGHIKGLAGSIMKGLKTGETFQFGIDVFPASRGLLFQKLTKFLSDWAWLIFFSIFLFCKLMTRHPADTR